MLSETCSLKAMSADNVECIFLDATKNDFHRTRTHQKPTILNLQTCPRRVLRARKSTAPYLSLSSWAISSSNLPGYLQFFTGKVLCCGSASATSLPPQLGDSSTQQEHMTLKNRRNPRFPKRVKLQHVHRDQP